MRTDPRYARVKAMITDPAIPRSKSGVLRLCHSCQRWVHLRGGFLRLLQRTLEYNATHRGVAPRVPV